MSASLAAFFGELSTEIAPLFAGAFLVHGVPVTWFELTAFVLAIAMVVCNMRVNPAGWPLAIASSLLYCLLFARSRLYGDAALQIFFVVIAVWGWRQWLYAKDGTGQALRLQRLSARGRWALVGVFALAWPVTGLFLRRFTDTDVPWWDAFPTALSVIGQWLLGRKYVENWPTWIVVNVVSASLFAYKELWLTTALYVVFIVLSFIGWRAWQAQLVQGRAA